MKPHTFFTLAVIMVHGAPVCAAPANDDFADALAITAPVGSLPPVNTSTATSEPGEPLHAGAPGGKSIWFRFTPAVRDRFIFNTNGSDFDTVLAAYTGSAVSSLTELATDDESGEGSNSLITFTAGPLAPVNIAIDGYFGNSGDAVLSWSPAPLTNNDFATAISVGGTAGGVQGWNFRATAESGEPYPGTTVWYRWIAPASSTVIFSLSSPDTAAVLGIYTGDTPADLVQTATSTAAAGGEATLSFAAVSGVTYQILVSGVEGGTGEFRLAWGPNGGSTVLLPDITSIASTVNSFMYGWTLDQTAIPGRTLLRVSTATANIGAGALEVRGSEANPAVYQRVFNANGTYTDRLAGAFTFHPSHGHLHFDNWLQFHLREVTAGGGVGEIIATGDKTSSAIIDLEPHDLGLPGAPAAGPYYGGLVQGISVGWRDVYSQDLPDQWIDVTSVPPGSYWLESVVDPENQLLESDETNNTTRILITYAGSAPPNNSFASATVLSGATAATDGRNYSASKQSGEPAHAGNAGGKSVWYRWTAPRSGPVTISTAGSSFNTLLGVYTGTAVNALTPVSSNDDDGTLTTSSVSFNAIAGTIYRIAVDGKSGAAGTIEIAIDPGLNDQFAASLILSGDIGTASAGNRSATAEPGEPAHSSIPAAQSVWWQWTAPLTGDAAFTTEGSSFPVRIAVYKGGLGGFETLEPVADSTAGALNAPAHVTFHIDSGATYFLAADGGPGVIKLAWQAAAAFAPYVISHPVTGNHQQGSHIHLSAAIGGSPLMTFRWSFNGTPLADGLDYSGTATQTLTVWKAAFTDSGGYTLTGTNPSGSVTTNPANIIVIANPRTVSITSGAGDIGGSAFGSVLFNATGNEHSLQFTLSCDPAVISNGRVTAGHDAGDATVVLDRSAEASGRLGITLSLPAGATFPAGLHHVLELEFDISPAAAPGITSVSFAALPVVHQAISGSGVPLPVVFDPGYFTLEAVEPGIASLITPGGGGMQITVRGVRGRPWQLMHSADLGQWTVLETQTVGESGSIQFTLPENGAARSFFQARQAP